MTTPSKAIQRSSGSLPDSEEQVLRGVIRRVTFHNRETGYAVLRLQVPEIIEEITIVGTSLSVNVGSDVVVRGSYIDHPKFGRQFKARSITETPPASPDGLVRYLSSGLLPGVGEKIAQNIVQQFGEKTLEVIFNDPERLSTIRGLGKKRAISIGEALSSQREMRGVMQFLVENQISTRLATRIFERYQNRAVETLTRDPYILARDLRGVGFATADTIAQNLGLAADSPQRLRAGVYYALERACDDGHCFLDYPSLMERSRMILELPIEITLEDALNDLITQRYVTRDHDQLYLTHLHQAECFVAEFIAQRSDPFSSPLIAAEQVDSLITTVAHELSITFSSDQMRAVHEASCRPMIIVTGGPGCGKTTVIRALAALFTAANKRLALVAPTGRAAQRMAQVTNHPASTIHRLLGYEPKGGGFRHGVHDPLPIDALIVDESSMIDISLAHDLFAAIPKNAAVVLVGDRDQLPSVGPGRVFSDLISSRAVPTVALSQLFRRSEESSINQIAHAINSGFSPDIPEPDGSTKADAYLIVRNTPDEAATTIEKLLADQIPRKFDIPLADITVLTPSNRGPIGTQVLNQRLQAALNPENNSGELVVGELHFRVGDRVCQRVNNYQIDDLGVFNGDIGHIYGINLEARSMIVEMWDGRLVTYQGSDLYQLSLAYAISVHRSQGSELPAVILALHESHYGLLERQLVYTAVTRAKKLLIVVGTRRALSLACRRANARKRASHLVERINDKVAKKTA